MSTTPHITELRQHLMDTLANLRDRENPMDVERARAVAQVAGVLVDSAKVEVDYIRATGADRSEFLESLPQVPLIPGEQGPHNPFPTTVHRIKG